VEGVDYDALVANVTLESTFADELQTCIAEAANVSQRAVSVSLSRGSVVVTATITPHLDQFDMLVDSLSDNSTHATLAADVMQAVSAVPHILLVTNGAIAVTVQAVITSASVPSSTRAPTPPSTPSAGAHNMRESDRACAMLAGWVLLAVVALNLAFLA